MSSAEKFNRIGQSKVPQKFAAKLPDLMNIVRTESVPDGKGGFKKGTPANTNADPVPCFYGPDTKSAKSDMAESLTSVTQYIVLFAYCSLSGAAYSIKTSDRLQVLPRGAVSEQIFKIIGLRNTSGLIWEAVCEKEN